MSLENLTQRPVRTIQVSDTVAEAARLMCEYSVGALVITDAARVTPKGIITDRDLVWMISEGWNPQEATVGQFVGAPLQTVQVTDSLADAIKKMGEHGVRRLPIVDQDGQLRGLVSLDDILMLLGRQMADAAAAVTGELDHERRVSEAHETVKLG